MNIDYNREGFPNFSFFDPRIGSLDITIDIEIFGLGLSIYTILVRYLPYGPSILKTT